MRRPFTYTTYPQRILFDSAAQAVVPAEVRRLGLKRILVVRTPGARSAADCEPIARSLGNDLAATYSEARVHVPIETLRACVTLHRSAGADGIVAIGGGSAIGLGKLVAAETKTPLIAVPTTYSGAELTPFNAVTEAGAKVQRRDPAMMPASVVYDPELTLTLPLSVSGPSMMNALAHAVEGMYAPDTNPIVVAKAEMAIGLAATALPAIAVQLHNRAARRDLLLSAMLAGEVLAVTAMGLHHKLCHILGGGFDLPHAGVNAVILPYAVAYNTPGCPEVMTRIAAALGAKDAAAGLYDLAQATGAPSSLAALGLPQAAIDAVARTAAGQTYDNPMPLETDRLRRLLDDAWCGRRPQTTL